MSKRKGSKAAAIREYLSQKPTAKAKEVVEAMAERRIKVTVAQVYGLKSKPRSEGVKLDALLQAKKLVDVLGGVDKAKAALDVLAKLRA